MRTAHYAAAIPRIEKCAWHFRFRNYLTHAGDSIEFLLGRRRRLLLIYPIIILCTMTCRLFSVSDASGAREEKPATENLSHPAELAETFFIWDIIAIISENHRCKPVDLVASGYCYKNVYTRVYARLHIPTAPILFFCSSCRSIMQVVSFSLCSE